MPGGKRWKILTETSHEGGRNLGFWILDFGLHRSEALLVTEADLKQRTKALALRVIKLSSSLPRNRAADVIARQILRSGTSPGANYRAACRGRSNAEFVAKLAIVEEELDETIYWLELLAESGLVRAELLSPLSSETEELLAIIVASIKTARRNRKAPERRQIQNPKSKIQNHKGAARC